MMVGVYRGVDAKQSIAVKLGSDTHYINLASARWLMNRLRASIAAVEKTEIPK